VLFCYRKPAALLGSDSFYKDVLFPFPLYGVLRSERRCIIKLYEFIFIMSTIVVIGLAPLPSFADDHADSIANLDQLPEGQTLLLRPRVDKFFFKDDLYALRKNNTLYYSLGDLIDVLDLSIDFDEDTGQGQGWFLREDWPISIDLNQYKVLSRGEEYSLNEESIIHQDDLYFIKQDDIEKIFAFSFKPDVAQQYIGIESEHPLPLVAKAERRKRRTSGGNALNAAVLPRVENESSWLDLNTADVRLGTRFHKQKGQQTAARYNGVVAVEGQALKHNAYGLLAYDNDDSINSAVFRLSERSEQAELLGPLKARSYALGDTNLADIPLTGDVRQETGFRVSNNKLDQTQSETTDITGDAIPGWDVELYRNGILTATTTIDQSGQYQFQDVPLFGGDNNFELFFYGPQGEIRNKKINVPVTAAILASQDGVYDMSVSLSDTQTFRKNQSADPDRGTPHIAARYNKVIGNALTYIGVNNRNINEENKTFFGVGATGLIGNTILDGNLGVDEKGASAARVTARRSIGGWDLASVAQLQSDNYRPNGELTPQVLKLNTSAQKNFMVGERDRASIFTRGEFSRDAEGGSQISRQIGGSYQKGRINISDSFRYDTVDQGDGSGSEDRLDNAFSVRANFGKVFLRGGVNYDFLPDRKVDQYNFQASYRPTNRISGDVLLDHDPDRDLSRARLNLNYTNDYFRASPFVDVTTNHDVTAGLNVNFSVVDDPNDAMPTITSDRVIGRGLVSSFVYHDKNGNNIYDGDDEPLPGVVVESVNVRRRVETNDRGYSLIDDLPTSRATDIKIDEETLPDSFMIAGFEGVSVLPNAGEMTQLEFPVHLSGEIDGTVLKENQVGEVEPLKHAVVNLFPLEGGGEDKIIKAEAASDGFYVASQIPPGKYLVAVSDKVSKKDKQALSAPEIIEIGYDGQTIYGHNFDVTKKGINIPIEVSYAETTDGLDNGEVVYAIKTAPQKRSRLLTLLGKLKQQQPETLLSGLSEVSFQSQVADDYKRFATPSNDLESSYQKCRELAENALPCTLEVIVPQS